MVFVGIDWAEKQHDVELISESGQRLRRLRISHGVQGLTQLQETISEFASESSQVVVGIESDHGLLVNVLVGSGYTVYPVNPKVAAQYRDRQSPAGSKSDAGDAGMLANLVRNDRHRHRPLAGDSDQGLEIRARARAHLRAIRVMLRMRNQLRSLLLEFYPAVLPLLAEEDIRDALAILSVAPNPLLGRGLSRSKIESTLRRHGRQRNLATRAVKIQELLRGPQLELNQPRLVSAHSDETASLVRRLLQARQEVALLEEQLGPIFRDHPDADIYLSFPGLADVLGARVLGESGDDPTRYRDARSRRNYVGNSPVTRASGKKREVRRRVVRNRRLADATFCWAQSAINVSPGACQLYERLRARGKHHNEALRVVANKLVGILHACLRDRRLYDADIAWRSQPIADAA
jgi:transposase/transposase IS116/IS110/IS902 family protein